MPTNPQQNNKQKKPLSQTQKLYLLVKKAVSEVIEDQMPDIIDEMFAKYFPEEAENQTQVEQLQESLELIQTQIANLSGGGKARGRSKFDAISEGTLRERSSSAQINPISEEKK